MTATIAPPFTCPHGAYQAATERSVVTVYSDGCRTTGCGVTVRFWCGPDEMFKPRGVSIFEGEYLRDWDDALALNAGDELYDEAVRLNEFADLYTAANEKPCQFRGLISKRPCTLPNGHDEPHDVWGGSGEALDEYADEAVAELVVVNEYDICGWCGGLEVLDPTTNACISCHPRALDHADYLGEVPWTDRVDD